MEKLLLLLLQGLDLSVEGIQNLELLVVVGLREGLLLGGHLGDLGLEGHGFVLLSLTLGTLLFALAFALAIGLIVLLARFSFALTLAGFAFTIVFLCFVLLIFTVLLGVLCWLLFDFCFFFGLH